MQLILEFEELKKLDANLDNVREHTRDFQDPDIIPDFIWEVYVRWKYFLEHKTQQKERKQSKKYMWECKYCMSLCLCWIFVRQKKKDTPTAEFFSEVSKRQRNPIENFKTQSVRVDRCKSLVDHTHFFEGRILLWIVMRDLK